MRWPESFSVEKKSLFAINLNLLLSGRNNRGIEKIQFVIFFFFKVTVVNFHGLFLLSSHSATLFLLAFICLSFPSAFVLAFQYVGRTNSERVSASLNVVTCLPSLHLLLHLPFFPVSPFFIPLASASDSRVRDTHTPWISV